MGQLAINAADYVRVAGRIIAVEDKIFSIHRGQIALIRQLAEIHWPGGWRGRDGRRLPDPVSRFVKKFELEIESGCWRWNGSMSNSGYGLFGVDRRYVLAHRFSVLITKGLSGGGLVVDHICGNPRCVNPVHLEEVTQSENVKRGIERAGPKPRATHCKRGHALDDANTYYHRKSRACRICGAKRKLEWQRTNRG